MNMSMNKPMVNKNILAITLVYFLVGCNQANITPSNSKETPPTLGTSAYVFGHLGSFIMNPDCLYKFENDILYTTHRQPSIDVNNPPAYVQITASDSIKAALKNLLSNVPSSIVANSTHQGGSYFPDMGYTYLQIQDQDKKSYWSIQANTPSDVTTFASQLMKLMNKLGQ
jgi:hypothetical protein